MELIPTPLAVVVRIVPPDPTLTLVAVRIPTVILDEEEFISKLVAASLPVMLTSSSKRAVPINCALLAT